MSVELKRVKLDEIELFLELLKNDLGDQINAMTSKDIAALIQTNFDVVCTEQDIFLLHEPTIEQDCLAMEIYYKSIGLYS
jgi:hypothetical protein